MSPQVAYGCSVEPPKLSKLVPVPVKDIWPLEASAFTPWLLANADVLGEALGIDLELSEKEHKVGGFSLDLIGRDASTDSVRAIRQLEDILNSVVQHLTEARGGSASLTLEVNASSDGFDERVRRVVSENANQLGASAQEFEE